MLLSTQLALAAAQQPLKSSSPSSSSSPSAFLSAYVSMLNNSSLVSPSASTSLSEKLKASRFSPYSKPDFKTITSSASSKVKSPIKEEKQNVIQAENSNKDENNHVHDEAET